MRTRWFTLLLLLVIVGAGGWWYWQHTEKDRIIAAQKRYIAALEQKLDQAWSEESVADIRVDSVTVDPKTGESTMDLTFIQYAPNSEQPAFQRPLTLQGTEMYVDAWVVQFDRSLFESGAGGKSLLLFRRAFGDKQRPIEGTVLYRSDDGLPIPQTLQVDPRPGLPERQFWAHFWDYANDPAAARAAGISVAQGEAPHVKVRRGQVYELTLRKSGGLKIRPRLPAAVLPD